MNTLTIESLEDTVEYEGRERRTVALSLGVAGHGDYGIIREPCPVHLTKHEKIGAWLWQEGSDWL
mgnify:CR=1 FL=1